MDSKAKASNTYYSNGTLYRVRYFAIRLDDLPIQFLPLVQPINALDVQVNHSDRLLEGLAICARDHPQDNRAILETCG